ncbi:MAG TPA: YIP1 family protein [Candidatus Baltobacteraceae bacterium]|nr:YIP1 family protein [Verrucomicrobiae bacterium]HTX14060.1 YIP1 family protein [Candidatus Baltobacteraceae bacterium]
MADAAAPLSSQPQEIGSFARLIGVLVNPRPTFESIVRRPTWVVPIALGCVLFITVVAIFSVRGGWPAFFERQDAKSSRFQQLSQQQQDDTLKTQIKIAPTFAYVEGVVVPILAAVVVAAVLLGVFNLSGSTSVNFNTALGIVAYAWTPWLIHGLVSILILFLKDPSTVDLQNLVASNPGALLSDDAPKWLTSLLTSFDIFAVWTMILLAIGFSSANPKKLSFGKALSMVVAVWLFFVIAKVGLTSLFS